jgi:geranylgeranyl diphosphate synthase type II
MKLQTERLHFDNYMEEKISMYVQEKNELNESILYSLRAPGKRVRPLLVLGAARGFGGDEALALCCGVSVEMIHCYSLIHDDLPAMDNDDYRRGQLTNHKVFGEALAILAGDALLNLAPEFLLKELHNAGMPVEKVIRLTALLLQSSGHQGMVKGQALDMKFDQADLRLEQKEDLFRTLKEIHHLKTGSIITWSCVAGLFTHSDQKFIEEHLHLAKFIGEELGLLFQIVDDILDVTSTKEELGKTPGKDEKKGKLTYTTLFGLDRAREIALEIEASLIKRIEGLEVYGDWSIIKNIIADLHRKASDTQEAHR